MKKLAFFCGMAALGMFAMNASATIPEYYESANIMATLTVYNGDAAYKTVSFNNKDMLTLIADEFGSLPAGAQLAIYDGLAWNGTGPGDSPEIDVLRQNGNYYEQVNSDGDSFELYFYPDEGDAFIDKYVTGTGDTYNYEAEQSEFYYRSGNGDDYFYLYGLTTDTVNWDASPYTENFKMAMGQGYFDLPNLLSVGDEYGTATGTFSGSGRVDYPFDY